MEEVPCDDEIPAVGYFTYLLTNMVSRVHNEEAGAGNWLSVGDDNIVDGLDTAGAGFPLPRLTADGEITGDSSCGWMDGNLVWRIPFGWNNHNAINGVPPAGTFAEGVRQVFSMSRDGDFGVSKLSSTVQRKVNGEVYLNGVRVE